ncbi:hypothetical protein [Vitiosangium sp. GDMCC 1.1324]|uniref:hypothetical protein n=1 Tax=Vitiosangium sp. (strain GDMCC 1.1324) TaxID=2138576 RepID=UPI000D3C70C0|nr:hypothetical protein [Vitiosangium sp. GDMCC 1.1324]PTL76784.1 hypothetical protein DAT35_48550 [Vitiosangium sp. GDMCC 1.1324]
MKTVTYERNGRTNTGAQAVRVEGMRHLRVLEQGETVVERDLTKEEVERLRPLLEEAEHQEAPAALEPAAGGPRGMAVSLAFEDEETPRVRMAVHPGQAARREGTPYDALLEELDALLTDELHARAPRHAHAVLPHELRQEE